MSWISTARDNSIKPKSPPHYIPDDGVLNNDESSANNSQSLTIKTIWMQISFWDCNSDERHSDDPVRAPNTLVPTIVKSPLLKNIFFQLQPLIHFDI